MNKKGDLRMLVILTGLTVWLTGLTGCGDSDAARRIEFGKGGESEQYRLNGWSQTEEQFTWTEGTSAQIALPISPNQKGLKLTLTASGLIHEPELPFQPVEVYANGQKIVEWQAGNTAEFVAKIAPEITKDGGTLTLEFRTPKATSPKALGLNQDPRVLGICVRRLQLEKI
jgi:hypothetical protein